MLHPLNPRELVIGSLAQTQREEMNARHQHPLTIVIVKEPNCSIVPYLQSPLRKMSLLPSPLRHLWWTALPITSMMCTKLLRFHFKVNALPNHLEFCLL